METILLRAYDPMRDEADVYALWRRVLGGAWPLSRAAFRHKTVGSGVYRDGDHRVAVSGAAVVGFVGTQARAVPGEAKARGEVMVVLVDPAHRRRGVGRALLGQATEVLRGRGAEYAQLGSGALHYFWPGVPANLPRAWEFFHACGWPYVETSYDLIRDLTDYATPPGVYERIRLPGAHVGAAMPGDAGDVLTFEARHFPQWLVHYEELLARGGLGDVVVARDGAGRIQGTTMVVHPGQAGHEQDFVWQGLLGESVGGVGTLGVAEEARENGLGLALAARVTEILHAMGVAQSLIGCTWLVDWYGRLGYRVWREYRMSRRGLT